ncbi:amidase [Mycobacterium aquaticum]|uniref:amidase n=1 Tax=Mycobacterium aquaticum TaxID=1927124 RepID=A0A1X0BA93_9MYCO|nr:amidase [Mycobacterium aquaticum]ORA39234.1 hypothetical protein BST13_02930 [Mycobacterium aquaticum]
MATTQFDDVLSLDATAQAALVRSGDVSAVELLEATISRLDAVDDQLNVLSSRCYDEARQQVLAGLPDGPFTGVPFLVKDLIAEVAGTPQTEGSPAQRTVYALGDSELVRRYRRAGLVIVGRSTTSEYGHAPVTDGRLCGPTRNPWDPSVTAGGSSGGSGAAVAARAVAVAHGNDAGGSLRIPAACCGVFGLRPTPGLMPMETKHGILTRRFVSEHVIARTTRDSAAVLDCTRLRPAVSGPGADPHPRPLRIAVQHGAPVDVAVDAASVAAVDKVARVCESLGHTVIEAAPSIDGETLFGAWFGMWSDFMGWHVTRTGRRLRRTPSPDDHDTMTWTLYETSQTRRPAQLLDDLTVLDEAAEVIQAFLAGVDIWMMPVLAQPPRPHGAFTAPGADANPYRTFSPFCRLANIAGVPACSVPTGGTDKHPRGVQLVTRRYAEHILLDLAAQLEHEMDWASLVPPMATATRSH